MNNQQILKKKITIKYTGKYMMEGVSKCKCHFEFAF